MTSYKSRFRLIIMLHRRLWRGRIYFCASLDTSFHMTRIWRSMHSSIKVITITGLIILGIVLDLGGKYFIVIIVILVHSYSGFFCRRTKSWSNRIPLLDKPWTICSIQWHPRRERPVFGLLGCLDSNCFLISWDWNCCCKSFWIPLWSTSVLLCLLDRCRWS